MIGSMMEASTSIHPEIKMERDVRPSPDANVAAGAGESRPAEAKAQSLICTRVPNPSMLASTVMRLSSTLLHFVLPRFSSEF